MQPAAFCKYEGVWPKVIVDICMDGTSVHCYYTLYALIIQVAFAIALISLSAPSGLTCLYVLITGGAFLTCCAPQLYGN